MEIHSGGQLLTKCFRRQYAIETQLWLSRKFACEHFFYRAAHHTIKVPDNFPLPIDHVAIPAACGHESVLREPILSEALSGPFLTKRGGRIQVND